MNKILEVKDLKKKFRTDFWKPAKNVLHNISFGLTSGSMTGFLGVNGAGKSTTIKCILGFITPDSGEILFFENQKLDNQIRQKISYLPEKPQLYDFLTGREFLNFTLLLSGEEGASQKEKKIDEILELVDLKAAQSYRLREYSKGMYQRMGLAQAILRNSQFMFLDEPMADLDPSGRALVKEILKYLQAKKEMTVLMSSHLLQDIEDLCDQIVILDKGEVKYSGETRSFINKLNPKFEIQYCDQHLGNQIMMVDSEEEVQKSIDFLRKEKKEILSIQNQKSLESAFKSFIEGNA